MVEEDKEKTTCILEWGAYAYNIMPFSYVNALATFLKMVTKTFKEYLNKFMQVFLDDFSVYGSKKDHLGQLQKCLEECRRNDINFNLKKCAFYVDSSVILGHIICNDGLLVDPKKIIAITKMPIPIKLIEINRFLGIVGFYQHYFQKFANKIVPMCKLVKKDEEFKWTEAYNKSWEWMKTPMTCLPMLKVSN